MKALKYLSIFFISALCLGFAACSDDDEEGGASIVGYWHFETPSSDEYVFDIELELDKDGEFYLWMYADDGESTSGYEYSGEYEYINGKLYLESNYGEDLVFKVVSVTDRKLKLEIDGETITLTRDDDEDDEDDW